MCDLFTDPPLYIVQVMHVNIFFITLKTELIQTYPKHSVNLLPP
jgi:hypothetical protein